MTAIYRNPNSSDWTRPAGHAAAVTPNDSNDLTTYSRGLFVGVSGDVKVDMEDGEAAILFKNVIAGVVHPIRAKRVYSTGTTATSIVALW